MCNQLSPFHHHHHHHQTLLKWPKQLKLLQGPLYCAVVVFLTTNYMFRFLLMSEL